MTPKAREQIAGILQNARALGRECLLESEGMEVLRAIGVETPLCSVAKNSGDVAAIDLSRFPGDQIVLKVLSKDILHKTEVGGVRILKKERAALEQAIQAMHESLSPRFKIEGYSLNEKVAFSGGFGSELLVSLRSTEDFGPILTVGSGGTNAEFLGGALKADEATAILDPSAPIQAEALRRVAAIRYAALPQRGQAPLLRLEHFEELLQRFAWLGREFGAALEDFEVNPFVISQSEGRSRLVALDALVKLRTPKAASEPRPIRKLKALLSPRSIAIMGVSEKMNPGRVILQNTLDQDFPAKDVTVIKPGSDTIDGCRCIPDLKSLSGKVDLLVLAVSATQARDAVIEAIEAKKAESIVLIPGGLEEKSGSEDLVSRMRGSLLAARKSEWSGPVINGGNCLGIRSAPGKINTLFIPDTKLPLKTGSPDPLAIISQSGAFSICRLSKMGAINPRYTLSIGNQMDLTVSDYLEYLKEDSDIRVFAVYLEGFKPGDGRRFIDVSREIVRSGRPVILYTAGRTAEGAAASASHTASIAGNWEVTRQLAEAAGILVAQSIDEFEDLTRVAFRLRDTRFTTRPGKRPGAALGAISNAGFECVAFADSLGHLFLPEFSTQTNAKLAALLDEARISGIVDLHNPLDLTPMANDAVFEKSVRVMLEDESVDCGVVGCVPLTPAIVHDAKLDGSFAQRLRSVRASTNKPFVAVIDSGALYDSMSEALEAVGIPVFRTADRALKILDRYCSWRLIHKH